jgi:hypothetical protein
MTRSSLLSDGYRLIDVGLSLSLSLTRGRVCHLPESIAEVVSLLSVCTIYILHVMKRMYIYMYVYTIYTRPLSIQAQYSRSWPIISCPCPLLITSRHGLHRKHRSSIVFVSVATGTCVPSRGPWFGPQKTPFFYCCVRYLVTGLQARILSSNSSFSAWDSNYELANIGQIHDCW